MTNNTAEGVQATRILIADDQPLYREGLRQMIGHWPEFEVVAEASNGQEAVEQCEASLPDLVLMDVRMPVMNGLEASRIIIERHPEVAVVILSVTSDEDILIDALSGGVKGYILKDSTSAQLRSYLQETVREEGVFSGEVAEKIMKKVSEATSGRGGGAPAPQPVDVDLTSQELRLLQLVAQGLSNEEIGEAVYASSSAVKKQLRVIMKKVGATNRVHLATYVARHGLLE